MNKKNKVLLASVGLAIFSGIAATSTTFAWFTTTQNASLSFNSATVETQDNNLNVATRVHLTLVLRLQELTTSFL